MVWITKDTLQHIIAKLEANQKLMLAEIFPKYPEFTSFLDLYWEHYYMQDLINDKDVNTALRLGMVLNKSIIGTLQKSLIP